MHCEDLCCNWADLQFVSIRNSFKQNASVYAYRIVMKFRAEEEGKAPKTYNLKSLYKTAEQVDEGMHEPLFVRLEKKRKKNYTSVGKSLTCKRSPVDVVHQSDASSEPPRFSKSSASPKRKDSLSASKFEDKSSISVLHRV